MNSASFIHQYAPHTPIVVYQRVGRWWRGLDEPIITTVPLFMGYQWRRVVGLRQFGEPRRGSAGVQGNRRPNQGADRMQVDVGGNSLPLKSLRKDNCLRSAALFSPSGNFPSP